MLVTTFENNERKNSKNSKNISKTEFEAKH